jgi:ketosteroid isomerase-like protein
MNRDEIEAFVLKIYEARVEGDMGTLSEVIADDAKFQIAGSPETSILATMAEGHDEIMGLMQTITDTLALENLAILDLLVDGNKAAVRWRTKITRADTSDTFTTELADFIEIRDSKVVFFTEFLDTALAG